MGERTIYLSETDLERLERHMAGLRRWGSRETRDRQRLEGLEAELDRAPVLPVDALPRDVVTMHTPVRVTDLEDGHQRTLMLVFPEETDSARGKISVLAPIGTALLGYRVGDTVTWQVPDGLRRFRIDAILSAPGAPESVRASAGA